VFDQDGSGNIDMDEMRHALLIKANLVFDESLLAALMKEYDDDNTGQIDYRKFCENVMGSRPDDAGGWGSSYTGSSARIPVSAPAAQLRSTRHSLLSLCFSFCHWREARATRRATHVLFWAGSQQGKGEEAWQGEAGGQPGGGGPLGAGETRPATPAQRCRRRRRRRRRHSSHRRPWHVVLLLCLVAVRVPHCASVGGWQAGGGLMMGDVHKVMKKQAHARFVPALPTRTPAPGARPDLLRVDIC
jgi:hypothetical protein